MATSSSQIILTYQETVAAVIASLEDGAVPLVIGAPGVGKTAMHAQIAEAFKLAPVAMIAREYEPHEISGVMDVRNGVLTRHVVGPAKRMIETASLGMFDEITASPGPVFANMARVLHERTFGDTPVHSGTLFMAAANPQSQSLDANDMPLPLINRLRIFFMRPTIAEVQGFFARLGEPGSRLRLAGIELASILDARPELVELEPTNPTDCTQQNINWSSPRSWERAVRTIAREVELPAKVLKACLIGDLGPNTADAYLAIRNTYKDLPSVKEICANPEKAKLPKNFLTGVGVLSMLGSICESDPCAAWVYCARVDEKTFAGGDDTRIALASALGRCGGVTQEDMDKSEHTEAMRKARVKLNEHITKARGKV